MCASLPQFLEAGTISIDEGAETQRGYLPKVRQLEVGLESRQVAGELTFSSCP